MSPKSRIIPVELPGRCYDVVVGAGLIDRRESFPDSLLGDDALIVTNDTVDRLYGDRLKQALGPRHVAKCTLPDGERFKTLDSFSRVIDSLVDNRMHRDATVIALGGGVVGDIAGFAAACYQRGVAVIQVPTTLLAQVDASVGGKTGVNHAGGKNLIGAFHQPVLVLADVAALETLCDRQYRAGLAEVVKYGAGLDCEFLEWLENNAQALVERRQEPLIEAVGRCCEIKARIVEEDEREAGRRALLNLGHTFGHAFETATGFGRWLHGEAVSAGMVMAAMLSERLGYLDSGGGDRIRALLERFDLPVAPPDEAVADLLDLMGMDKKVASGRNRFVLLHAVGDAFVSAEVPDEAVTAVLREAAAP
jgi:3-dehydroquinate synthase